VARIVMAGFPADLGEWLKNCFVQADVCCVAGGLEVIEELRRPETSLLVLDHRLHSPTALEILTELRNGARHGKLPVIYCLSEGVDVELAKRLVRDLGVKEILLPPIDPNELARQVARTLGLPAPHRSTDVEEHIQDAVADVRRRFLPAILSRVEVLEQTGVALLESSLLPELREQAEREAHKLAGLLGTLGYAAGSRFAREIEELLQRGISLSESQALRFSELTVALRLDVESTPLAAEALQPPEKRSTLLVVDRDEDLAERIEAEAAGQNLHVQTVREFHGVREAISTHVPDVVLLDLLVSGQEDDGMALLEELSGRTPPVPVIVLTSKDGFTDRVEVARRGGRGFLAKTSSAGQIVEAVTRLMSRLHAGDARIMAVDDDPQVLALLRNLLGPRKVCLETLDDPLRFWDALGAFAPDLLVLDVDMPHLSGIELCRVVRNDVRWAEIPVIFLTRHDDAETINRVFTAGADDFVAKPIVGPELLTRIFNRLDRLHLRRNMLETDPVTGIWNRRKASQMMADFLDLARRHGQPFSLALIGVAGLKDINERQGYGAGDARLRQVSQTLSDGLRSEDVFGRWSGDEFVVGMYGLSRYDGVQRLAQLLEAVRQQDVQAPSGDELHLILSAGVAQYGEDGTDLESLCKSAKAAMLHASTGGGGKVAHAGWVKDSPGTTRHLDVVLVMHDEAQASLLLHGLESRGYRTRWLQDGKTAAKLLAGPDPLLHAKVVLIDVDLSGLDGISLLKRLAWDGVLEDCRAIILTSPSVANEAQVALELGAVDYVAKPFNPPVVVQHIRRALDAA